MKSDVTRGLKELLSFHKSLAATSHDLNRGILHGSLLGASGLYCFGPVGGIVGFGAGMMFNILNAPSHTSWKKFVTKRVPSANVQKQKEPFSWKSAALVAGTCSLGFLLSKKGASDYFDFSSVKNLQLLLAQRASNVGDPIFQEWLKGSIDETIGLVWKLSFLGYMANGVHKTLLNGFAVYGTNEAKKFVSSLKSSFQSPEVRIKACELLAEERFPAGIYLLQKTFIGLGRKNEALATILNYYFKENLSPLTSYYSRESRKQIVRYELQNKPPLDLFIASLLLPTDNTLTGYYASLAIQDAQKNNDVASLALLATYQSYTNNVNADETWRKVASLSSLSSKTSSLEEKVLGEGNSGGAFQIIVSGVEDDPLRWSLVTLTGDEKTLRGKYELGKAIFPQTKDNALFPTPRMITLQEEGSKYRLFRQQLWGTPLHEFSLFSPRNNGFDIPSLYADIFTSINNLQNIYDSQKQVEISNINWNEKFFSKNSKNNFYDKKLLEESLDWMLNIISSDTFVNHALPVIDPYVKNIGVMTRHDGSIIIPYWDVEPKGRAPRMYDYATLLLTAKPYLSSSEFEKIRTQALLLHDTHLNSILPRKSQLHDAQNNSPSLASLQAYAGALTLRTISLLKAWSNAVKQPGMASHRYPLLSFAMSEMEYLRSQDNVPLSNFAEKSTAKLIALEDALPALTFR